MDQLEKIHSQCEALIRAGEPSRAAGLLTKINTSRIPRPWRWKIANLCRRVGLVNVGLRILAPVVRPQKLHDAPMPEEIAEYAVLLQRVGAWNESLDLLGTVDTARVPSAHLYSSWVHFRSWDGKSALANLEAYLRHPLPDYQKLVGRVNLSAALIVDRQRDRARELVDDCLSIARAQGNRRIEGNCLELKSQLEYFQGDFLSARRTLQQADELFSSAEIYDQFFVKKWQAIVEAQESGSEAPLRRLRAEASQRGDYESMREADFYLLKLSFNEELFCHLYFGTPSEGYRRKMVEEYCHRPERTTYKVGHGKSELNLQTGELDGRLVLNPGKQAHRLLGVLLRDLYRPVGTGEIFAGLFPDEYFNIISSPNRVHQAIVRARKGFASSGLSFRIVERNSAFCLELDGSIAVLVPLEGHTPQTNEAVMDRLRARISSERGFSAKEAREALDIPASTFKTFATWALENGYLERRGSNRSTVYRWIERRRFERQSPKLSA